MLVKIGKYIVSCVYRRSYLLWSPVIESFQAQHHSRPSQPRVSYSIQALTTGIGIGLKLYRLRVGRSAIGAKHKTSVIFHEQGVLTPRLYTWRMCLPSSADLAALTACVGTIPSGYIQHIISGERCCQTGTTRQQTLPLFFSLRPSTGDHS